MTIPSPWRRPKSASASPLPASSASVALPFQTAQEDTEPFADVPLGYRPYHHQALAFARLRQLGGGLSLEGDLKAISREGLV